MKTKEVIRQLNEADPTGEVDVCIDNVDIHFIDREPAYYDGPLQVLVRDEAKPGYNIVGAKYKRSGEKVQIHTLSVSDAITNFGSDTKLDVDYSELSYNREETKKAHEELRQFMLELDQRIEREAFVAWVKDKADALSADADDVKRVAESFFDKCIDFRLPIEIKPTGQSYNDARKEQWESRFLVQRQDGFIKIACKEGGDEVASYKAS